MTINGKPRLACRTLLKSLKSERIVLEPLPNLEILKDLVVDMDPFWEKYERIKPWLHAAMQGDRERTMTEADCRRIDSFTSCILCALCYGACPVLKRNEDFTGPAALAKLYRFLSDSREQRSDETLNQENSATGLWGCHTITRCIDACPKNVRPTDGITGARRKLLASHMKSLVRKKG
jgi:succinate dehydrogenase / fumarate reductase iron-sulfur subunit